jgi:hypothetical protein
VNCRFLKPKDTGAAAWLNSVMKIIPRALMQVALHPKRRSDLYFTGPG